MFDDFKVPKDIRIKAVHYFIMKILSKKELQQTELNHSYDIEFKNLIMLYKNDTKDSFSILVNITTSPPRNPLRFRKKLL